MIVANLRSRDVLVGVIRAAHQGAAFAVAKTQCHGADADLLEKLRAQTLELLRELLIGTDPRAASTLDPKRFGDLDPATLVNRLGQMLPLPALEKQSLLEEDTVSGRLDRLATLLQFHLRERDRGLPGKHSRVSSRRLSTALSSIRPRSLRYAT